MSEIYFELGIIFKKIGIRIFELELYTILTIVVKTVGAPVELAQLHNFCSGSHFVQESGTVCAILKRALLFS